MSDFAERLYQLLPTIYRIRDGEQGYSLRALIEVLAGQAQVMECDTARLYENWFIETCDEWVVPYIGDLVGVRGLLPPDRAGWSQRALVANTLQYRQRKGTVPLLEQLVHDVTGWAARAVELFNAVSVTQYLDHLRPGCGGTANLRGLHDSSIVGSAFDPFCYTPDVRRMSGTRQAPQLEAERPTPKSGSGLAGVGKGRPNLPNMGLYIWRLKPYRMEKAAAYQHPGSLDSPQRFSFSQLGNDLRLFNAPGKRQDFSKNAREHELPVALRRQALLEEIEAHQKAMNESQKAAMDDKVEPTEGFLTGQAPAFEIYEDALDKEPIGLDRILIADLAGWDDEKQLAILVKALFKRYGELGKRVVVDPEQGRLLFPPNSGKVRDRIRVTYSTAFSHSIGGGPYDRRRPAGDGTDTVTAPAALGTVIPLGEPAPDAPFPLGAALEEWAGSGRLPAVFEIAGNPTYHLPAKGRKLKIDLGQSQLVIQGANRFRPVIVGDLTIAASGPGAGLTLSGLLIAGQIQVADSLGRLTIIDCTCLPGSELDEQGLFCSPETPSITVVKTDQPSQALQIHIERSIVGPLILPSTGGSLSLSESIVDARICQSRMYAIAGTEGGRNPGPPACLDRVTVFGEVHASEMVSASDVLFSEPVTVDRTDSGKLAHCYVPPGSKTPRQDSCVNSSRIVPSFTTQNYGEPGYAQLSLGCPAEIRAGGTNGSEIGAFHRLRQPQREGALLAQLEEYLRFGLEAGLIYVD